MAKVLQCEPQIVDWLKMVLVDFARNMDEAQLRTIAEYPALRWVELCQAKRGRDFEHLL